MRRIATITLGAALAVTAWVGGSQACGLEAPSPDAPRALSTQIVLSDSAAPRGPSWRLAVGAHVWFERGVTMAPAPISLAHELLSSDRTWRT